MAHEIKQRKDYNLNIRNHANLNEKICRLQGYNYKFIDHNPPQDHEMIARVKAEVEEKTPNAMKMYKSCLEQEQRGHIENGTTLNHKCEMNPRFKSQNQSGIRAKTRLFPCYEMTSDAQKASKKTTRA